MDADVPNLTAKDGLEMLYCWLFDPACRERMTTAQSVAETALVNEGSGKLVEGVRKRREARPKFVND